VEINVSNFGHVVAIAFFGFDRPEQLVKILSLLLFFFSTIDLATKSTPSGYSAD